MGYQVCSTIVKAFLYVHTYNSAQLVELLSYSDEI